MRRLYCIPLALFWAIASALLAAEKPAVLDVWPGKAPGEKGDIGEEKLLPPQQYPVQRLTNVSRPTITVYRPEPAHHTATAVLICPGGGYSILAMDLEGEEVATWLNSIGVTGIVLKYRVPARKGQPRHLAPLQDAQRAMSLVRANAKAWNIDTRRIGILGFSAGGHLAAATATNYDQPPYESLDPIDHASCRPDFAVLIYPGYLAQGDHLSPEIRVGPDTPPTFLAQAYDDGVGPENSTAMFLALRWAKVPAELHIYSKGGHGFGLRTTGNPCCTWPQRCQEWMKREGFLPAGH